MWLDYDSPSKPIYLYINSSGTQVICNYLKQFVRLYMSYNWLPNIKNYEFIILIGVFFFICYIFLLWSCLFSQNEKMETVGSETEAYAIADTMAVSSWFLYLI